tara:strand:- start:1797 stop:1982 length:186 start_codon:yes stop_codon:yes gene_type:complete
MTYMTLGFLANKPERQPRKRKRKKGIVFIPLFVKVEAKGNKRKGNFIWFAQSQGFLNFEFA